MRTAPALGAAILASALAAGAPAVPAAEHVTQVLPNNPCYAASCGPDQPVVEYPTLGAGITGVHPDGQTNLWAVNASQAWAITKGNGSLFVAVLDTGVDPNQPQLEQKVVVGPNECSQDLPLCAGLYDDNGHGTFVTGLITAAANDHMGIVGLGWATKVIDIKVLDSTGHGDIPDEVHGIYDAIHSRGARVMNLSWTDTPCKAGQPTSSCSNGEEEQEIESAVAHGVVVVAASGDGSSRLPVFPADYPGVLSVAASTDQGVVDPQNGDIYNDFSDYGNDANIAAPGISVLSTWYDGNYAVGSGTSFAAPLVAAAAALVMAAGPKLSGPQVATLLIETSGPLASGGTSINGGFLNVWGAVQAAGSGKAPTGLYGYQLVSPNGMAYNSGFVAAQEMVPGEHLDGPVVAAAEARSGLGYWMVTRGGRVVAVGGAHVFPPRQPAQPFASPVTGIVAAPDDHGYWVLERDGNVHAFGDARDYPASRGQSVGASAVAMAPTPDGRGYWVVSAAGDVSAHGDAGYFGSTSKIRLNKAVAGVAATPDGRGYWLVGSDGGVFNFGDAGWYAPSSGQRPTGPVVGLAPTPDGLGYWLAGKDGQVWRAGDAPYEPSEPIGPKATDIVAISS